MQLPRYRNQMEVTEQMLFLSQFAGFSTALTRLDGRTIPRERTENALLGTGFARGGKHWPDPFPDSLGMDVHPIVGPIDRFPTADASNLHWSACAWLRGRSSFISKCHHWIDIG